MTVTEAVRILHPEPPDDDDSAHEILRCVLVRAGIEFGDPDKDKTIACIRVMAAPWSELLAACEEVATQ